VKIRIEKNQMSGLGYFDIKWKAIFTQGVSSNYKTIYPGDLVTKEYMNNKIKDFYNIDDTVDNTLLLNGKSDTYYTDISSRLSY
jgi:hypothetical protein